MSEHQNPKSPFAQVRRGTFNRTRTDFTAARDLADRERTLQLACLDAMQYAPAKDAKTPEEALELDNRARRYGLRPLKPPPGQIAERRSRAGELDARKAKSRGPEVGFTSFVYGRRVP